MAQGDTGSVKNVFIGFNAQQVAQGLPRFLGESSIRDSQLPEDVRPQRSLLWTLAGAEPASRLKHVSRTSKMENPYGFPSLSSSGSVSAIVTNS
jgi:hypothetical protein